MIQDKKIVITGGGGFIGSHLTDALVEQNDVTVIDNLSTGRRDHINNEADFATADIRDYEDLKRHIGDPDLVFHLSADAHTRETSAGWDDPIHDLEVNALGTLNLLEVIRESEIDPRIVFASSCALYGEPEYTPMDEEHPMNPISPYGTHKLAGDRYMHAYASEHDLDTSSVRIFNTYGPRQPRYVMYDFLKKLQQDNGTLEVLGSGNQVRDYTYIDDAVQAFKIVAEKGERGEAYNMSGESAISIGSLAELMIDLLDLNTDIHYTGESWKGDPTELKADVTKLKNLGYQPSIGLEEGLGQFIEYFRQTEGPISEARKQS